jgi:dCTP deaminase
LKRRSRSDGKSRALEGSRAENDLIGYRAKKHAKRIDLERRDYDPLDFWEPIRFHKTSSLLLDPDEFYILMTREAIAVPPDYVAEMSPYDTCAGEFRVHYAGFFDPGFGWDINTNKAGSSRGVLEVRSHEVLAVWNMAKLWGGSVVSAWPLGRRCFTIKTLIRTIRGRA